MDSGKIQLPPIQDMLCRPLLSFPSIKVDKDHYAPQLPLSPTHSSSYLGGYNYHHSPPPLDHQLTAVPTPYYNNYWEQHSRQSADYNNQQFIGYTNHTKIVGNNNATEKPPLQHHHSRSYSLPYKQYERQQRRSSASSTMIVDPSSFPNRHRRTISETLVAVTSNEESTENSSRYKCHQCLKTFSRPSSLRIHVLSHTGEKPHVCPSPGCGRRFSVQSNMRRHLKVHCCNPVVTAATAGNNNHFMTR